MAADTDGDLFMGDQPPRSPLGWAVFLAVSWTWCIGMYLPVILLHEFTLWGWVAFTIPNVLGAGAMGWVLRNPESSRRIVAAHGPMLALFSLVTVAFQAYFAGWMLPKLGGGIVGYAATGVALVLAGLAAYRMRQVHGASLILAQGAYIASIAAFVVAGMLAFNDPRDAINVTVNWQPVGEATRAGGNALDLVWFAPTFVFGFLLCPYLDLTFHRARQSQESAAGSRFAFGVGFGGFFLVMLLFSLLYAGPFHASLEANWVSYLPAIFVLTIVGHMVVQLGFTMAVHLRELMGPAGESDAHHDEGEQASPIDARGWGITVLTVIVSVLLGLQADQISHAGMAGGEVTYRLFMGFYGLVFPAYVWLCMIPRNRWAAEAVAPPDNRQWLIFLLALALAGPLFYLGYIQHQPIYLAPGLAIVLLARLVPTPAAPSEE